MKISVFILGAVLFAVQSPAAPPDFSKVIQYSAPTNFYRVTLSDSRSDPGDNPMALKGPMVLQFKERYDYRHPSEVRFEVGLAGAYIGPGKVIKFLPVTDESLKENMEAEYKGKFSNATPVTITKINGLTAACFTATRTPGPIHPYFLHYCWVQVETNIVLKAWAFSSDTTIFQRETNSLQSLKIDKAPLLRMLYEPTAP